MKSKKMVKVYRAFIRVAIQAIRYSGGYTRQFAGDGIMAVFQNDEENGNGSLSAKKAVRAGRYIQTLMDFCLNPALKERFGDICIGCGVGISTGTIMITKVGMRGRETDETSENETGIVWVGSTTNYASRYCSLAKPSEVFIDEKTYKEIKETVPWKKETRTRGDRLFTGYVASKYYLPLPENYDAPKLQPIRESSQSQQNGFVHEIMTSLQREVKSLIAEIAQESAELARASDKIHERESAVSEREREATEKSAQLLQREKQLVSRERELEERMYYSYKDILLNAFLKDGFVVKMGREFWDDIVDRIIDCGEKLGENESSVRRDICYYLVSIYEELGDYEAAYYALCIQAETCSWISINDVSTVLSHTYLRSQLRDTIKERLENEFDMRSALESCLKACDEVKYANQQS